MKTPQGTYEALAVYGNYYKLQSSTNTSPLSLVTQVKCFRHYIGSNLVAVTKRTDTHSFEAVLKRPELQTNAVNSNVGLSKLTHPPMIPVENRSLR